MQVELEDHKEDHKEDQEDESNNAEDAAVEEAQAPAEDPAKDESGKHYKYPPEGIEPAQMERLLPPRLLKKSPSSLAGATSTPPLGGG